MQINGDANKIIVFFDYLSGFLRIVISTRDDTAGIEIIVESLGFAQKFRAEEDVVHTCLLPDVGGAADRDRGFDDDCGPVRLSAVCGGFFDQSQYVLYRGTVKKVLLQDATKEVGYFLHRFQVSSILKRCNGYKQKGFPVIQLFTYLVTLMFR